MPLCFYKQENHGNKQLIHPPAWCNPARYLRRSRIERQSPQISEDNTVITCGAELSIWDICAISSDAEAFGLQVKFGYDGHTRITFTPKEQPE